MTSDKILECGKHQRFLLPCPSRGMTGQGHNHASDRIDISTPMPLAGHDRPLSVALTGHYHFYSHAPRGA